MSERKQWRPYLDRLQELADRHAKEGKPAPELFDDQYWKRRAED
jgi:hypothetical protein